jgi:hypothetical protein
VKWVLVFVAAFVNEWVWAAYIHHTAQGSALRAAILSGIIMGVGAYVTLSFLDDPKLLAVAIAGGIAGTYVFVKKNSRQQ